MKYWVLTFCILFNCVLAFAQSPGGVTPTAWFKADGTLTLSGSTVTQWNNDASGATVHLTTTPTGNGTTTANAKPSFLTPGLNFNPAVTFNGLQGIYNGTALGSQFISNNNNSYFIVFSNVVSTGTSGVMFKWEYLTSNRISSEISTTGRWRSDFPTSSDQCISSTTVTTNAYLGTSLTSASADSLLINGVRETVLSISSSADNTQTGKIFMGSNANGAFPYTGYITEMVLYNSKIGDVARNKVQSYLAVKYGFTLGTTSNAVDYVNSSNTTIWTGSSTYQNNVAGIGRDDNSGLNQKQSYSNSGGGVVTMAILASGAGNSIPSTNASNANTFSADNTFLLWGHNGNSLYGNRTDLPSGIQQKSQRTWKTQLTGTGLAAQNVRVKFDLSSLTLLTVTDYTNYRLLLDANGVFAAGATLISPVTGNNSSKTVEFDVTMASYSGYYFTIGTTNTSSAPLPLQFLNFTATQVENKVQLNWKTTAEVNCKNFEIEWSKDAQNWEKIGTVDALNKSEGINNYSFIDENPHSGLSYYRIKQVDFDGIFTYSTVQSVTTHKQINVSIEPNPADDFLEIYNKEGEEIVYSVFDMNGKHIQTGHINAQTKSKIETEQYRDGLYLIDFLLHDESYVQKFVVKH